MVEVEQVGSREVLCRRGLVRLGKNRAEGKVNEGLVRHILTWVH